MTIFDKKEITQKDVDELNKLLCQAEFDTLKKASRKILGDELSSNEVKRKADALRKKLNTFGYYQNKETKTYENPNIKSEINEAKSEEMKNKKADDMSIIFARLERN